MGTAKQILVTRNSLGFLLLEQPSSNFFLITLLYHLEFLQHPQYAYIVYKSHIHVLLKILKVSSCSQSASASLGIHTPFFGVHCSGNHGVVNTNPANYFLRSEFTLLKFPLSEIHWLTLSYCTNSRKSNRVEHPGSQQDNWGPVTLSNLTSRKRHICDLKYTDREQFRCSSQ